MKTKQKIRYRHKRMELLEDEPIVENACTICCDLVSDTVLVPCMHRSVSDFLKIKYFNFLLVFKLKHIFFQKDFY